MTSGRVPDRDRDVVFDPAGVTLRLSPVAFRVLVAAVQDRDSAQGTDEALPMLATLQRAGVIDGQGVHPQLRPALAAAADPICRLALDRDDLPRAEGWVGARDAVLLLPGADGMADVVSAPTPFLPVTLARLVGLGARPKGQVGVTFRLPATLVPATVALDLPTERIAAILTDAATSAHYAIAAPADDLAPTPWSREVTPIAAAARDLAASFRSHWQVRVWWGAGAASDDDAPDPHAPDPHARSLRVLDTASGLWLVEPHDATRVTVTATTSTQVWQRLCGLLPDDADLAPTVSGGDGGQR